MQLIEKNSLKKLPNVDKFLHTLSHLLEQLDITQILKFHMILSLLDSFLQRLAMKAQKIFRFFKSSTTHLRIIEK
jgi:hypothetical protein